MVRILLSLLFTLAVSHAAEVDVYLLGGQSNMQGLGKLAELTPEEQAPPANVFFWTGKDFEPLVPGKTHTSARAPEFGPEIAFAREIAKAGKPAFLIKYHVSGMPLDPGWDGNHWAGGPAAPGRVNFHPGERDGDPATGKLYRAMLKTFRDGLAALRARGDTPVIRGFVWMQGEQDAKQEVSAAAYAANLKRLRDRLAQDVGAASLPMAFGQVLPHPEPDARFTQRDLIRRTMAAADMASGKPEAIPHCRMVSTDGFPLIADKVHYSTRGQLLLGKALADGLAAASR